MDQKYEWYAMKLVIINVIIFVFQAIFPVITDNFVLVSADVVARPWILVTSMFLHGSITHLFYNMFALALFGSILEKFVGSRNFLFAYFLGGIVASIGSVFFYAAVLGASGAIFAIQGYLAAIRPKMMMWVYGAPMPMFVAVILWAGFNFAGLFFPAGIAYASHLFGLAFGILFGIYTILKYPHVREQREKKHDRVMSEKELDRWEDNYMRN
ncbi:MAG: rhomboid family intramembrane serine protease [Candidatus Aenigmatarchaeota archaeon]|nr:rhomboid family intramembrane serine protease [Nanoarchaeota archaeon]